MVPNVYAFVYVPFVASQRGRSADTSELKSYMQREATSVMSLKAPTTIVAAHIPCIQWLFADAVLVLIKR